MIYVWFSVQQHGLVPDNNGIESRLKKLEASVSELQGENAEIIKHNDELRTKNADIRKENADLKVQVVSGCVNHITFSLNTPLCSSLLSLVVSLSSRCFSMARHQLTAQTLH